MNALHHFTTHFYQTGERNAVHEIQGEFLETLVAFTIERQLTSLDE